MAPELPLCAAAVAWYPMDPKGVGAFSILKKVSKAGVLVQVVIAVILFRGIAQEPC